MQGGAHVYGVRFRFTTQISVRNYIKQERKPRRPGEEIEKNEWRRVYGYKKSLNLLWCKVGNSIWWSVPEAESVPVRCVSVNVVAPPIEGDTSLGELQGEEDNEQCYCCATIKSCAGDLRRDQHIIKLSHMTARNLHSWTWTTKWNSVGESNIGRWKRRRTKKSS